MQSYKGPNNTYGWAPIRCNYKRTKQYLYSLGWELCVNGATSEGAMAAGYGASETTSYWIIRKPCTKEEFDKAVEAGISN